jgi:hypothetical protein
MKRYKIIGMGVALMGLLPIAVALAAAITISPNLPGPLNTTPTGSSPGAYIKNFYSYALFLSGLLAFGAIVYGGIKYAIARGNPSGESEAKQWIWSALLGMLLLAGAYIILFTINPNLVNLALPALPTGNSNTSPFLLSTACTGVTTCGGDPGQLCNGTCPDGPDGQPQTCGTTDTTTGRRSCVAAVAANACSNANPQGTCADVNAKCQSVNGNFQCVSTLASNPACRGVDPGNCVYIKAASPPAGCESIGGTIIQLCTRTISHPECYQRNNC